MKENTHTHTVHYEILQIYKHSLVDLPGDFQLPLLTLSPTIDEVNKNKSQDG